ncbi:prolipoprotein diacylglyceryl transferase [Marinicella gelatinilytica]|uniref:prolipoprotein diacylglyceryl transferase n=1 Tax=Marinicella gelatinilytica TaxID=2996017 RepID=UPI002260BDD8|nr:prolipoprotein diacylglyceryl transferase [Marinicella gelatinilytica]MCX7544286.1 prolipoprotein diacylglyceryl transferase [Marinicella gelatinilytica]
MQSAVSAEQNLPYVVDFDPIFINLGPLDIHWYGITYLVGFGLFYLLGRYRIRKYHTGWNKQQLSDVIFYGALGVVLGGRIGWYLFYNDTGFSSDPLLLFKVWEGGMSFHGGLAGVLLALVYFKNKTNKTFYEVSDFVAPLTPLGIASVRMGNFINGELWGRITDQPWAMIFPQSLPYSKQPDIIGQDTWQQLYQQGQLNVFARHPSPLYEAFLEGIVTFVVVWVAAHFARKRGTASAVFLLSYGFSRFFVEFFREPDANRGFIAFDWMTMGHILTLPIIAYGLWILWSQRNKQPIKT